MKAPQHILVIGAGHAGVEAALASARMGIQTSLITMNRHRIAMMPCNPSIGGPAKGIVVREIDALGGEMGWVADKTALQFRLLNATKGPGVQCLRVQSDKIEYSKMMEDIVHNTPNLTVVEAMVERLVVEDRQIIGVELKDQGFVGADAVILTSGTYMSSLILVGHAKTSAGPDNQPTTNTLSESIRDLGLRTFRLKTGTPPRIKTASIDFSVGEIQEGDRDFMHFSARFTRDQYPKDQWPCYLIYTQPKTHEVIELNLDQSAMYSGAVEGVGPRYCPSIEDKLVRFADKERHQIFLEPESRELDTTYIQGFSTSMPHDVQEQMIRSLPGFENSVIDKYAYAIEYDAIDPTQLKPSLEVKTVGNLFCAGQINGTSGYEEAAGQGIMAGINAALKVQGKEPLILGRDEAYIGVMIDDLVTKGTQEPYRLLTSRAEHRLLLRHDNAEARLSHHGHRVGLLPEDVYARISHQLAQQTETLSWLKRVRVRSSDPLMNYVQACGYDSIVEGMSVYELLKRPRIELRGLVDYLEMPSQDEDVLRSVEIEVKYEGYIAKALKEVERLKQLDHVRLPEELNYDDVPHLSNEGRQKLQTIKPFNLGQASRISGVNPSDLMVLKTYLNRRHPTLSP
jgi:tRNA uridine 5-carboxymethylaminomethyl modification enzyme